MGKGAGLCTGDNQHQAQQRTDRMMQQFGITQRMLPLNTIQLRTVYKYKCRNFVDNRAR